MTRTDAKRLKLTKTLEEVHALADRVLSAARAASRRPPRVRAPGPTKEAKREEHRASTGELREAVWERCGGVVIIGSDESGNDVTFFEGRGRCEVSGVDLGTAWEMHHLDAAGHRRSHQSLDNVLAVSWEVHRLIHRGDMPTLRNVKEACIRLGLREGLRAIEHRIAKVNEARQGGNR